MILNAATALVIVPAAHFSFITPASAGNTPEDTTTPTHSLQKAFFLQEGKF